MTVLRDVKVPHALLHDPDHFGGTPDGDCLRGDLPLSPEHPRVLLPSQPTDRPRLLLPALVEAHCHLDKCHSIERLGAVGGDLAQAIAEQAKDKAGWNRDDLHRRMSRGLDELVRAGCSALRSHIDWGQNAEPPLAWQVLEGLAQDHPLTIQRAALTGIDQLADPDFCGTVAKTIASARNGVLGSFVLGHPSDKVQAGLDNAFRAAAQYGLALDFHVDEGLGDYNGLEAICDAALSTGFQGPVLCGHAVSMIDHDAETLSRVIDKVLRAGITICALPTTNLYLQGRKDGTPDRRGLTRLRELHVAGVPIVVASDNVADAFCPVGQHDPRAALHLAVLAAHLGPPMDRWLPAVTLNAARALGLPPPFVDTAPLDALRLCEVSSTTEFIASGALLTPIPPHAEISPQ
ncbi:MAG: amidohydrolase family protein [Roseobacter sp.]|nr:amidohydrolase family protein [Roseobacter sp.]